MKSKLDHLPEKKRGELAFLVDLIRSNVDVEMIILFGSYARGDWVEELAEDETNYKYQSDFDLLVVVKDPLLADKTSRWNKIWADARRVVRTPVSIIPHDIEFVNRRLRKGQYFFTDIKKEGVLLYTSGRYELVEAKELTPAERRKMAEEDFGYWYGRADSFFEQHRHALSREDFCTAAFELHQTTERLYGALLLVYSRYKPSTHDLEELGKRVAGIEPCTLEVFPQGTPEERRRFQLLRKAYVDARYKPSYQIAREDLQWLEAHVAQLKQLTESLCRQKIASFAGS